MIKHKKLFTLALSALMVFGCVFAITANKGNIANAGGACSHHVGNHYTEKSPSVLEGGTAEYYICCNCHNVILADEHTEGDGDWTNKGTAPSVDSSHRAFLEPTVTKAQVEEKIAELENTVAINTIPGGIDQLNYDNAKKYVDAYLLKKDTAESDLIGIENYHGAGNVLKYKGSTPLGKTLSSDNTGIRSTCTAQFGLVDESINLTYNHINNDGTLTGWDWLIYLKTDAINNLPDGPLQIFVRPENECKITSRVIDTYGVVTTCPAGKWTAIVFDTAQVALAKKLNDEAPAGPGKYYGNGVNLYINCTSITGDVDFTSWYECYGKDLTSYNLISNENYHYGGIYAKGGVTVGVSSSLQSSNSWFKGLPKAANITSTTRDNFMELKYTHNKSTDQSYTDFKYDSPDWLGNDVYAALYFNIGSELKKTVKEMFIMVYSNVETDIHMSNFFGICKKEFEPKNVLTNTKIYKGWNLLNFIIPENGLRVFYTSGTFFTLVPTVWKAGIELTMTGLFYKETGDTPGDTPADFEVKVSGDDAKIINFTDLHIDSADDLSVGSPLRTTLTTAMTEAKPDLVTFSGDVAWYEKSMSVNYILGGYQDLCNFMDTFNVPYFFTFGNHDREYATVADMKAIIDSSKYGKIALSPTGVGHDVNYSVDIFNKNDQLIHTLIVMDTGSYKGFALSKLTTVTNPVDGVPYNTFSDKTTTIYGTYFYDNCDLSQVDWYEHEVARILNRSARISNAKSSLVMHIPFVEYHFAFEKYQKAVNDGDTTTIAAMDLKGRSTMSGSGACGGQFGFFEKIKTLGNTMCVTCGHDHNNSFSLLYEGVRLTYGVKTGAESTTGPNGYTGTYIASDGTVTTTQNFIS